MNQIFYLFVQVVLSMMNRINPIYSHAAHIKTFHSNSQSPRMRAVIIWMAPKLASYKSKDDISLDVIVVPREAAEGTVIFQSGEEEVQERPYCSLQLPERWL